MRQVTVDVYSFDELPKEIQEKVLQDLWDLNTFFGWWDENYEDAKNIGLEITGFRIDSPHGITGNFMISAPEVAANIITNHGDTTDTFKHAASFINEHSLVFGPYMDPSSDKYESEESESELNQIESRFLNLLLQDYLVILKQDFEYRQSEESIKETMQSMEYEFTADGKIFTK